MAGIEYERATPDLTLMNISYAWPFPDLDGAAQQANIEKVLQMHEAPGAMFHRYFAEQ